MSRKLAKNDFIGNVVQYQQAAGNKPGPLLLRVDYAEAPVPPHYYVADYYYVEVADFRVLIVFGKFDENRKALRNKLEIYVPFLSFLRQVHATSQDFHETIRSNAAQFGFSPTPLGAPDIALDKVQGKVQTIQSNNVLMAIVDMECMLDFFYLSPRELHFNPPKRKEIEIQALIRVMIDPPMMLGLLDECDRIAKELKDKLPKGVPHDEDEMESE